MVNKIVLIDRAGLIFKRGAKYYIDHAPIYMGEIIEKEIANIGFTSIGRWIVFLY